LQATLLEFRGLALIPERYKEEVSTGGLMLSAIVSASAEETEKLDVLIIESREAEKPVYFDVVRVGVSDVPMRMRFGRCLFDADVQEGGRQHLLRLVAEGDDAEMGPGLLMLHQPELARTMDRTIANHKAISVLADELRSAGVLDAAAVQRILDVLDPDAVRRADGRAFDGVKGGFDDYF
jgi:hypothetical protein